MKIKLGLIGIVGEEFKTDYWGTMQRVKNIGYEGIEISGGLFDNLPSSSISEYKQRIDDNGIKIINCHAGTFYSYKDEPKSFTAIIQKLKALDCEYITMSWGPVESVEQLIEHGKMYDEMGKVSKNEGITLLYHNHDHEFQQFDGKYALDILFENADADYLKAQIDAGWVFMGGVDPAEYIRKISGRVPLIHLKDFYDRSERQSFTELGDGLNDIKSIIEAGNAAGTKWYIVEQDKLNKLSAWDSITKSYKYIKELGYI